MTPDDLVGSVWADTNGHLFTVLLVSVDDTNWFYLQGTLSQCPTLPRCSRDHNGEEYSTPADIEEIAEDEFYGWKRVDSRSISLYTIEEEMLP